MASSALRWAMREAGSWPSTGLVLASLNLIPIAAQTEIQRALR